MPKLNFGIVPGAIKQKKVPRLNFTTPSDERMCSWRVYAVCGILIGMALAHWDAFDHLLSLWSG